MRRLPSDELRLARRILRLACQYGRYGYRLVTALLRDEGWQANQRRVERLWQRKGLRVAQKQPGRTTVFLRQGPARSFRVASYNGGNIAGWRQILYLIRTGGVVSKLRNRHTCVGADGVTTDFITNFAALGKEFSCERPAETSNATTFSFQ
jgi:transposase InsO family protein